MNAIEPDPSIASCVVSILVTGGAGYIGSHTVDLLTQSGRAVVVLDSFEHGHHAAIPAGVPWVQGDIGDAALVRAIVAEHEVDAVIHFAAYKAAGESMERPEKYFANNVASASRFFEAICGGGVRRVVFSSTAAVYGTPDAVPITEDAPLRPENPYGESKLMCEQMLRWYGVCHDMRSVCLRYFNAAGASVEAERGEDWSITLNLIPLVMRAALERGPAVKVFGTDYPTPDGTGIRDYIHVDDLAMGHLKALEYLELGGDSTAINLGTGVGSSVYEVLEATERAGGMRVPRVVVDRRPGDPSQVFADNRRARKLLGWQPVYGLEEIVESAFRWHSTHLDGYGLNGDD